MLVQFSKINIPQGSVTTPLGSGGNFNDNFVSDFLPSLPVNEFWKWSFLDEDVNNSLAPRFYARQLELL